MHPLMMAALISGGVNALQGKRGSDLLKSTIKDTAIAAVLGGAKMPGSSEGINQLAAEGGKQAAMSTTGTIAANSPFAAGQIGAQQASKQMMLANANKAKKGLTMGQKLEKAFTAIEKPFRDPKTGDISSFRVGLGSAGLGGAAYAAGLFDPKDPPDPKYPGFNKYYAANPEMFQPGSGQYGPDTDQYPEGSPYSGLQEGGIADATMMSPDDEMLQYDMQQQSMDDGPGIVAALEARFKESFLDPDKKSMRGAMRKSIPSGKTPVSKMTNVTPMAAELTTALPERIKRDFVMKFKQDPDKTAIEYATTMRDKDRLTIADVQKAKEALTQMTNETEMDVGEIEGIMGLMGQQQGEDVRIPQAPPPPALQNILDTFRSRATNEPRTQEFNKGDLVDVLPSKLKRDENDTSNYKRTSGKMVTDETGKGSGSKDTMLAQLADGEFVTKAKSVLGAGKAMGGKNKQEQRELGAKFFYSQMSELEKLAESA
jgi:hypothetical protein